MPNVPNEPNVPNVPNEPNVPNVPNVPKRFGVFGRFGSFGKFDSDKRGQYLVQTVILLPMLMILVGLVLDGGWMYWQYRRAEIVVNAAAQAASHAIDVEYFRETNQVRLDAGEAWSAASGFVNINQRGQMQVTGIYIGNNQVIVNANAQVQTIFFRLAGIASLSMRVEGRAYPAFGINVEGQ